MGMTSVGNGLNVKIDVTCGIVKVVNAGGGGGCKMTPSSTIGNGKLGAKS